MIQKRNKGIESILLFLFFLLGMLANVVLTPGKGFGTQGRHDLIQWTLHISAWGQSWQFSEQSKRQLLVHCKAHVLKAKGKAAENLVHREEGNAIFQEPLGGNGGLGGVEWGDTSAVVIANSLS